MLTQAQVQRYSTESGLRDIMIAEKEAVLTFLLQLLSERGILDRLAFKGGTCLRKMFLGNQGRFSTDALAEDFGLRGEPADIVEKAFTILDCGEKALPLAELAGLVAEGGLFVSATSFAAGILFPLGSALAVVKAMQGGARLAGMVAIGYTITAWVFDETVPGLSPDMQQNLTFSGRATR